MSISLLHIDCDIYSSTKDVFDSLKNNVKEGIIIVFDELFNYLGYENHEWKVFQQFLNENNFTAEYLSYNANHEQVAVKIHNK